VIRHIVLFTLRPDVPAEHPRVATAVEASRRLGELPHARNWMLESNISDRDIAADFAAIGDFEDATGLTEFLRHPAHVAAGGMWGELATWVVADLRLPSGH
jgi:Stress responsive A/B Barrel Domain